MLLVAFGALETGLHEAHKLRIAAKLHWLLDWRLRTNGTKTTQCKVKRTHTPLHTGDA